MRKRPLLWFACVFLCGLAFERYRSIGLLFVPLAFMGVEIYFGVRYKTIWNAAGRSLILLSAFLLGIWHMEEGECFRARYMEQLEDGTQIEKVLVWGEIIEIKHTDYGVRMRLSDCYIRLKEELIPCNDVLVYASSSHYHVGEFHKINGKLNIFDTARNEGNFDSKSFYQSQKIDFAIRLENSKMIGVRESAVRDFLLDLKVGLLEILQDNMDERAAGFFSGMLLGEKSNLEKEVKDLFELGGISHILAISGLHVSMIGRNIYEILRKMGIGFAGAGVLAGMLLLAYGFLVGNGMSAVRAIGMMLIFFLAQIFGRSYDMLNALGAMMLVLLWDNPFFLEYSGFWFSIMALMGVGFVGQTFSRSFKNSKQQTLSLRSILNRVIQGLVLPLGITLTTLPVVASCSYEIPLYSILVNAVVLSLLTPIFMLSILGALTGLFSLSGGILGVICEGISKVLLLPCSWGFGFYIWLCEFVEKLPFASVICGKPKNGIVIAYYAVLALTVLFLQRLQIEEGKEQRAEKIIVHRKRNLVLGISLICLWLIIYPKSKPFEVTFLDVGQGDAIYIAAGDSTTFFIDGGSTSEERVGEYRILPFLKYKGVASIDYWFVSHTDSDHISGIFEVLESGYDISHLVLSKYAPKDESMLQLVSLAKACNTQVIYMDAGDKIMSDVAEFTCIYPRDTSAQDKNEASLVLDVEVKMRASGKIDSVLVSDEMVHIGNSKLSALFAGDISSETEQYLLRKGLLKDVWLYKASHHGSKYSNSTDLLQVLQPEVSVVSCSLGNVYGHPHEEAVRRIEEVGSKLFYTMENGQVTIRLLQ